MQVHLFALFILYLSLMESHIRIRYSICYALVVGICIAFERLMLHSIICLSAITRAHLLGFLTLFSFIKYIIDLKVVISWWFCSIYMRLRIYMLLCWLFIALFRFFTLIIFLLGRCIHVLDIELAVLVWLITLRNIAYVQFMFMFFAVA